MVATFHSLGNNVTSYRLALMAARWNGNGAKWLNDGERYRKPISGRATNKDVEKKGWEKVGEKYYGNAQRVTTLASCCTRDSDEGGQSKGGQGKVDSGNRATGNSGT
uniref:Uncharacterized protein n=1 Tax=Anopheles coluzzii TaxID=1518534 RepID=A0A8W7PMT0_ANOCL